MSYPQNHEHTSPVDGDTSEDETNTQVTPNLRSDYTTIEASQKSQKNESDGCLQDSAKDPAKDTTQDVASADQNSWNRRRFLGGMLSGAAALVASACGRDRATPTPTLRATSTSTPVSRSSILPSPTTAEYQTYLPLVHNESGDAIAAAPTEVLEPTATPTPAEPTATPPPPPTPTPIATPFPPGPPSKLGLVVMRNLPQIFELLETQSITAVCTLELDANFLAQMKQTSPQTQIIARLPDIEQIQLATLEPLGAARAYVDRLLPYAEDPQRQPYIDGWQGFNEPVAGNADEMRRLGEFEAERTRLLAARGIRSVIGNFGTGQPDQMELWEFFLPAVQAAKEHNGWLGLHEYGAPTIYQASTRENQGRYPGISPSDTGWLTLRYRQVYNQFLKPANLAIPLVFTELGVDGLVANRPGPPQAKGWRDFQGYWAENGYGLWGPGAYIEQLAWFDNAMRQDDYVLGGCIYALAASAGWESYDIMGPAAGVLQQYLSVHTPG